MAQFRILDKMMENIIGMQRKGKREEALPRRARDTRTEPGGSNEDGHVHRRGEDHPGLDRRQPASQGRGK
eukprot:16313971-Heterocapsa_arctica.AAC.1